MRSVQNLRDAAVLVLLGSLVWLTSVVRASAPEPKKEKPETTGCELVIYNDEDTRLVLKLKKKDTIKKLVTEPLLRAVKDPDPAAYVVLGVLRLNKDDGSEEIVDMFLPWGHAKIGKTYLTCEFGGLRKHLNQTLERAADRSE